MIDLYDDDTKAFVDGESYYRRHPIDQIVAWAILNCSCDAYRPRFRETIFRGLEWCSDEADG